MSPLGRTLLNLAIGFAVVLLLVPAASGQTTTGSLSGSVTAQSDGSALPGVQVTAVHEPTGTRYTAVTGADGRFQIRNVRVGGPYNVSAALEGFHTQSASSVFVQLGETTDLRFQLQLDTIAETITVVGESSTLINPGRTGAASNISTDAIETLPTVDRSFNDFARTNPFMTISADGEDPDAVSVAGRSSRYNNITIDGSVNNDLFGLADSGTPGGQTGSAPISLDAIQELELVIADFDVRNGGFSGGSVNAITRSGSNDFAGSVFVFTRDKDLFGDGPASLGQFGDFTEDQYGFRLGGPLSKEKAFFFINADLEERSTPSGWSIDGSSGQTWANGEGVDEGNRFRNILINNYGFDPGPLSENARDNPSDKFLAKVDFNLNNSSTLSIRHNYVDAARDVNRPGSFTYEFPSETYNIQNETNSTVGQLNSVFGSDKFNELRVAFQTIKDRRGGRGGLRFPWIEIENVIDSVSGVDHGEFEAGTEPFSTRNALDQDILELHNDFTWLKGEHTITIGTHNELFTFDNLFVQNAFGAYEFNNLDDFEAGNARRFRFTEIAPGQADSQKFDVNQLGFYVGDEFSAKDNLTLNYGVRVDIPFFPDTPSRNPLTEQLYGFRTDEIPDGEQLWQPRIGFNWDIEGNGKSQLRGGAGIFAGRTPYVWISNQYARSGIEQIFLTCTGAIPFNPDPDNQDTSCASGGAIGEFNLIDPGFNFPTLTRYNLAYDRQLPWWDLVFSAEAIFADSIDEIDYANVNLTPVGTTFDGRPLYGEVDSGVDGAFLIRNTSQGESTNFAIKLERPYRDGFWGYVSYASNDSKAVNDGASSRAVSNYNFNEAFDPNNAEVSRSFFAVEDRWNASVSYEFRRDSNSPTTASLFYNLQSGVPFSWLMGSDFASFGFGASYNGDGSDGNDLAWVPASEGDVVITNGTWSQLDAFISAHPVLNAARGGLVERFADESPWNHTLDLHVAQDIPVGGTKLQLTFDILNLLNLLDDESGTYRFAQFNSIEAWELEGFTDEGTPIISLRNETLGRTPLFRTHNLRSRWRGKIGLRWTF